MGSFEESLGSFVAHRSKKRQTGTGKIKSISGNTCTIDRNGLLDLEDVRLNAIKGDFEDCFLIIPAIGSEVLYTQVENAPEENCIIQYTKIEQVLIKIGGAMLEITAGKFEIKNNEADLKKLLADSFDRLTKAIITTPSGPGKFSVEDIAFFKEQKTKTNKLFK